MRKPGGWVAVAGSPHRWSRQLVDRDPRVTVQIRGDAGGEFSRAQGHVHHHPEVVDVDVAIAIAVARTDPMRGRRPGQQEKRGDSGHEHNCAEISGDSLGLIHSRSPYRRIAAHHVYTRWPR